MKCGQKTDFCCSLFKAYQELIISGTSQILRARA
jgi:hypothetical protein